MRLPVVLLALSLLVAIASTPQARSPEPAAGSRAVRTLVVTGGHEYSTSFYTVFEQEGLAWDHAVSNEEAFRQDLRGRYDVVVLYDMSTTLSEAGRANFRAFAEGGGGVVVLHHAIVSYQDWPWYHELVGGAYLNDAPGRPGSTYLHDQDLNVKIVAAHPVTEGVVLPRIHDETYKRMAIASSNTVLLTTDHPASDAPLAWVSAYPKARVVYVQLGHGSEAHRDPGYRRLVLNAVRWTAGK
jgi:type 1 glutamine amidotransferase